MECLDGSGSGKYKQLEERVKHLEQLLKEQQSCVCIEHEEEEEEEKQTEEREESVEEAIAQVKGCSCSGNRFDEVIKSFPVCHCAERLKEKLKDIGSCRCDEFRQDETQKKEGLSRSQSPVQTDEYSTSTGEDGACCCNEKAEESCQCEDNPSQSSSEPTVGEDCITNECHKEELEDNVAQLEEKPMKKEGNVCAETAEEEKPACLNPIEEVLSKIKPCSCDDNKFDEIIKNFPSCNCLEKLAEKLKEKACTCGEFKMHELEKEIHEEKPAEDVPEEKPAEEIPEEKSAEEIPEEKHAEEIPMEKQSIAVEDYCYCSEEPKAICDCEENHEEPQVKAADIEEASIKSVQTPNGCEERVLMLENRVKELEQMLAACEGKDDPEKKTEEMRNSVNEMLEQFKKSTLDQEEVEKLIESAVCRCSETMEEKLKSVACNCAAEVAEAAAAAAMAAEARAAEEAAAETELLPEERKIEDFPQEVYELEEYGCAEDDFDVLQETEDEDPGEEYLFVPLQPISEEKIEDEEESCGSPEVGVKEEELSCHPDDGITPGNGRSSILAGFAMEILKHCSVEDILSKLETITAIEQKMNKIEEDIHNIGRNNDIPKLEKATSVNASLARASLTPSPVDSHIVKDTGLAGELVAGQNQDILQEVEALRNELNEVKEIKANVDFVEEKLAEKADAVLTADKVSEKVFEDAIEDLAKGIDDAADAVQKVRNEMDERDIERKQLMDSKVDKADMDEMKEYFQRKMDKFRDRIKELYKIKKEAEGAAVRTKTIRDLRCLVCNADVVMKETGTHYYGSIPKGRCFEKKSKGQVGSPIKKCSVSKGPKSVRRADSDFSLDEPNPRVVDVVSRFCGGSHTVTTPDQRVVRQPNIMDLLEL